MRYRSPSIVCDFRDGMVYIHMNRPDQARHRVKTVFTDRSAIDHPPELPVLRVGVHGSALAGLSP